MIKANLINPLALSLNSFVYFVRIFLVSLKQYQSFDQIKSIYSNIYCYLLRFEKSLFVASFRPWSVLLVCNFVFRENSYNQNDIDKCTRIHSTTCVHVHTWNPLPIPFQEKIQYPIELIWKCFFSNFRLVPLLTCQNELSLLLLLMSLPFFSLFFCHFGVGCARNSKFYLVCAKFNVQTYKKISFVVDWNGRCIDFHWMLTLP